MASQGTFGYDIASSQRDGTLAQYCRDSHEYPKNLVRSRRDVDRWSTRLEDAALRLNFDGPLLRFIETCTCSDDEHRNDTNPSTGATERCHCQPRSKDTVTLDELKSHLQHKGSDPKLRYIFVQSKSSRDRLNCTPSMFTYLCNYHQIPRYFLNSVYSLRTTHPWSDYNLAPFHDDNTLLAPDENIYRSRGYGREIRYSYALRSVETPESRNGNESPWSIRQVGIYHSFDVGSGRTLWVFCKGNSVIEDRIRNALSRHPAFTPEAIKEISRSFSASLGILTMTLDWCDDNWRRYIEVITDDINRGVDKVRLAAMEDETDPGDIKKLVEYLERHPTSDLSRNSTLMGSILQNFTEELAFNEKTSATESSTSPPEDVKRLRRSEEFSFNELKRLQEGQEKLQEACLALEMNRQVIRQIRDHYQSLMTQFRITEMENIQEHCRNEVLQLCCHSKYIEANMEAQQARLDSLIRLVQESKAMVRALPDDVRMKLIRTSMIVLFSTEDSKFNESSPRSPKLQVRR
ncbi:hypothetical protein FDECE_3599 [Fusarium decemcellulare]|nr:hypothetical protein FDECE_3599 [Fusarium decemcellulare]